MQYIFFYPLNQLQWARLFQSLWILLKVPLINPMQPWNCGSCRQNLSLLNSEPTNLEIDARCHKYVIVIYCTFAPIPHEGIILSHMIMFHEQDETKQMLFQGQIGWSPNGAMWLPCGPCRTNNGWDHKLHQFFKFSQSDVGERLKTNVVWLVTRMSHTPTSGLTDCPFFSSNLADVKYSPMLTQMIAGCTTI